MIRYTSYCKLVGLHLRPGQLAFAKVAYDGLDPTDLQGDERDRCRLIYGPAERIPAAARAVVVQDKGRDVGGTRMGAGRLVQLGAALPLDGLIGQHELAYCFVGAPKLKLTAAAMRFALNDARTLEQAGEVTIDAETADGFTLVRHDGRRVRFEPFAASRGGDGVRGVPIIAALLDEAGFFMDEFTGVVNDRDIFNAIVPRLLPGGQVLIVSSPWGTSGLLAEEFEANFGHPTTAIAAYCPTLALRDEPEIVEMVARERLRSPENAARELDARFLTGSTAAIPQDAVNGSFEPHSGYYSWGETIAVADPGESLDSFTVFAGQWGIPDPTPRYRELPPPPGSGLSADIFVGFELDEYGNTIPLPPTTQRLFRIHSLGCWHGPEVRALGMETIVAGVAAFMRNGGAKLLISDQRGAPYLGALVSRHGIQFRSVTIGSQNKHEAVSLLRTLMPRQISIVSDAEHSAEFKRQLLNYKRIPRGGGTFAYTGGTRAGVDDWPAALVTFAASMLLEERGTPTSQTHFTIDGSPTAKPLSGRHVTSGR